MRAALLLLLLGGVGCADGQSNFVGTEEPFRLRNAQFFKGTLPGDPPTDVPYVEGDLPRVLPFTALMDLVVPQGYGGKKIPGRLTDNGVAAGLALDGVGTGWWLVPAGDFDTNTSPPSLTFSATADFGDDIPIGSRYLRAVALDQAGHAGPQFLQKFCITGKGPADGIPECAGIPVPAAAISLTWDTQVDLDLQVLTPDGKLVTPKHPYVEDPDKKQPADPTQAHIDRDSNPNCVIDGVRRESLIWPADPADPANSEMPSGLYLVYVNLYSACNQQAVHFHVQVMTAVPGPPDADAGAAGAGGDDPNNRVEQVLLDKSGELIAAQASPSAPTGLFVTEFTFQ